MQKQKGKWRYALRWSLPHLPCPGEMVIISRDVSAGEKCPAEIEALWKPGQGYAISIDFLDTQPIRRWSPEARARVRRLNLRRRLDKKMPLFAEMFADAEMARRPEYFDGIGH